MEISDKLIERIEAYLDQSLPPAAQHEFAAEIAADPELAEEVQVQQLINEFLIVARRRESTKNKLALIAQKHSYTPSLWQQPKFWGYAAVASIALFILAFLMWPTKLTPTYQEITESQLQAYPIESFPISGSLWRNGEEVPQDLSYLVKAKALYKKKSFSQAFSLLERISHIPDVEQNGTLFYKGMCLIMTDQLDPAKDILLDIPADDHLYYGLAQWYIGLIETKLGNFSAARRHLALAISQNQLSQTEVQHIEQLMESLPY
ncbi:MAG: hypothetical protein AAF587_37500 [Bacteroidota bacterium]